MVTRFLSYREIDIVTNQQSRNVSGLGKIQFQVNQVGPINPATLKISSLHAFKAYCIPYLINRLTYKT